MSRGEVLELLRDVKRRPEEAGLRLILADWLEDHGDGADRARAELIRAQVRDGGDARGLIAAHKAAWLGPLAPWCPHPRFRAGLMGVTLPDGHLTSPSLQALAGSEAWAWVDEVTLAPGSRGERLATNPLLDGLNAFSCADAAEGWVVLEQLARSPWMEGVRRLDLSGLRVSSAALQRLTASPHLRNVTEVRASRCIAGATDLRLLAGLRPRRLSAARCALTDFAADALAAEPAAASLEELTLADNEIGDAGAAALAGSPYLGRLRLLTLFGNPIGEDGRRRLRERFGARVLIAGA